MLLAASVCLFACQTEKPRVYDQTAAAGIAGTYTGTWKLVDDKGESNQGEGTVVFAEPDGGNGYIVTITMECAAIGLSAQTPANVAHAEDDYVYFNNQAINLLPADASEDATVPAFQGRVKSDGSTSFSFNLKTGKGKKAKNNTYTFTGAR